MTTDKRSQKACAAGFDGAGHMDPEHAKHLLEIGGRSSRKEDAFIGATFTEDDLAEELAEAAVASMTSGQDELGQALVAEVEEERGGPFTETSGRLQFADGLDESNIEEATREPFPLAIAVDDDEEEDEDEGDEEEE